MNSRSLNDPTNSWKRNPPALETALSMLTRKALAGSLDDRGLADRRPGPPRRRIWADPDLIQPQHHPALPLGPHPDGRELFGQPARDRGRVLLQGPSLRPLGLNPQPRRYPTNGRARQPQAIAAGAQLRHRIVDP